MTKKNQTSFDKDKQPKPENRKPRGKSKKTLMLDAIRQQCGSKEKPGDEMDYLIKVVEASLGDPMADPPLPPNPALMAIVMNRIEPPLKSTSPLVEFKFSPKATPSEQASQVLTAAAAGEIPPDIAQTFVSAIASMLKIDEVTALRDEVDEIKAILKAQANG